MSRSYKKLKIGKSKSGGAIDNLPMPAVPVVGSSSNKLPNINKQTSFKKIRAKLKFDK